MEFLLRKSVGDRLTGWLSYSVQQSTRAELPFAYEQIHAVNGVLAYQLPGGWTFSGITTAQSGTPLTFTMGQDVALDGTGGAQHAQLRPGITTSDIERDHTDRNDMILQKLTFVRMAIMS